MSYRCTECDMTYPTMDAAARCHWGIGGVVGPEHCYWCSRPIYATATGWTHAGNRVYCYAPNGSRREARP